MDRKKENKPLFLLDDISMFIVFSFQAIFEVVVFIDNRIRKGFKKNPRKINPKKIAPANTR